jgi:hypothetical protein
MSLSFLVAGACVGDHKPGLVAARTEAGRLGATGRASNWGGRANVTLRLASRVIAHMFGSDVARRPPHQRVRAVLRAPSS